jgi:hypothetical protein
MKTILKKHITTPEWKEMQRFYKWIPKWARSQPLQCNPGRRWVVVDKASLAPPQMLWVKVCDL